MNKVQTGSTGTARRVVAALPGVSLTAGTVAAASASDRPAREWACLAGLSIIAMVLALQRLRSTTTP